MAAHNRAAFNGIAANKLPKDEWFLSWGTKMCGHSCGGLHKYDLIVILSET